MARVTMVRKLVTVLTSENVPRKLTIRCVEALSKGALPLRQGIKWDTNRLMVSLAQLMEAESGAVQFQYNCLMIIVNITAALEYDANYTSKFLKPNSPGAIAIVQQLLRVIEESDDPALQILATRSIGFLAILFDESNDRHLISILVLQLDNGCPDVATEAVLALQKFLFWHSEQKKCRVVDRLN
ncbi:Armadillo-like helical [Corchorus capsularis]|uniref:Armadillo-like helical n=1 Tax=Corchorus capsularis TaxID=210143 RepID=A0A1R3H7Y2_COCAP|nr:Armadillo-like helical [Corchorus capsularis]